MASVGRKDNRMKGGPGKPGLEARRADYKSAEAAYRRSSRELENHADSVRAVDSRWQSPFREVGISFSRASANAISKREKLEAAKRQLERTKRAIDEISFNKTRKSKNRH